MICGIKIIFFLITNRSRNLDVALFLLFFYVFTFSSIDIFTTQYINKMYDYFHAITLLTFFPLLLLSAFSCPAIPSPALLLPVFQQPQLRGGCVMTMPCPYPSFSCTPVLTASHPPSLGLNGCPV